MADLFDMMYDTSNGAEVARIDSLLYGHYSGEGQWLNSTDVDLAWARIDFLEGK